MLMPDGQLDHWITIYHTYLLYGDYNNANLRDLIAATSLVISIEIHVTLHSSKAALAIDGAKNQQIY